jgi:hypothetical protein
MGALGVTRSAAVGARIAGPYSPVPAVREGGRLSSLSTYLAIAALAMAMLPRLLTAAGAPALVNFLHFPLTVGAVLLVAPRMRERDSKRLVGGVYLLLLVIVSSAFLNAAGVVNAVLDFLLLAEPFLLLLLLTNAAMSPAQLRRFRRALLGIAGIHVVLAYYQYFELGFISDDVKGVFLAQGAGHHVAGAVALTTSAYLLTSTFLPSALLRIALASVCAVVVYFTDAKQVSLVFLASLFLISFQSARLRTIGRRLSVALLTTAVFVFAAQAYLPTLVRGAGWGRLENVRVGLLHKFSVFLLLESHSRSPANWLLGLGPGHTCGRLGELIPEYRAHLGPLGVTTSPVTAEVIRLRESHFLSKKGVGSSLWSPFFFWSGVTGDLGLAGLACVVALWALVWRQARDNLARFLTINALLFGVVFSWLEEPGYMMFLAALLGLRQQESRSQESSLPQAPTSLPALPRPAASGAQGLRT